MVRLERIEDLAWNDKSELEVDSDTLISTEALARSLRQEFVK